MAIDFSGGSSTMDYAEHQRTYDGFLRGAKVLTVLVVLILVAMAIFLL